MKISIIIPVFNEFSTISNIIDKVKKAPLPNGFKKEIIVIDDFSYDGTQNYLKQIKNSNIKILFHKKNLGKGAALKTGFRSCSGDIIIIQDADLEYDPNEYTKLLEPIISGKADVVYGSRFIGDQPHRILYFWHSVANRFLTLLSNMFSDLNLTDMETCYKIFKKEILELVDFEEKRFGFEPEITAKLGKISRDKNISIYEVGISYFGRTYEEGKKIRLKDACRAFWCIFKYNDSTFAHLIKYSFNGFFVAMSQIITIFLLVTLFEVTKNLYLNIAHAVSIEVSIFIGFFLHSKITWRCKYNSFYEMASNFYMFHLITLLSFFIRIVAFYISVESGVNYIKSTILGIAFAIVFNFFGYEKIVFKSIAEKFNFQIGKFRKIL